MHMIPPIRTAALQSIARSMQTDLHSSMNSLPWWNRETLDEIYDSMKPSWKLIDVQSHVEPNRIAPNEETDPLKRRQNPSCNTLEKWYITPGQVDRASTRFHIWRWQNRQQIPGLRYGNRRSCRKIDLVEKDSRRNHDEGEFYSIDSQFFYLSDGFLS